MVLKMQKNVKNKIQQVNNPSLTKAESARLKEIDTQLGDLVTQDKAEQVNIGAKIIAEQIGTGFEVFDNQQDVDSAIATLQEQGGIIDTKNSDNYGTFVTLPGNKSIVILNKEVYTEDREFPVGEHEVGHAVVYETVKNKPEAAIALGQALLNELQTNKNINIKPKFKAQLEAYALTEKSQVDSQKERLRDNQIPISQQRFTVDMDGEIINATISTNLDGSRRVRLMNKDGIAFTDEVISKDNTLSNEEYLTASAGEVNTTEDVDIETVRNPKVVDRMSNRQREAAGLPPKEVKQSPAEVRKLAAETMEEVLTFTSQGLTDGTIEINESTADKIGNFIRRALSSMGMKVKFKNGKDVLNFIKDYNRSVHRQKGLSRGLERVATEGAEVTITPETVTETEIKESVAKESKRVDETEVTPEQASRNKKLMQNIVEGDVSAANTIVQENSGLILGPKLLNFNPDITAESGVTSEDVLQAVADMMTPGMVDLVFTKEKTGIARKTSLAEEYAKEKGEVSTFLGRLAQRKKEIYTAAGLDPNKFNLVGIDSSTKQIIDEGSETKPKLEKEVATTQVDPREFGPVTEGNKLKEVEGIVKVTDKQRLTFKQLASKYFDKVSQTLFGMPGKKVKGNASLKYANVKGEPVSSEAL